MIRTQVAFWRFDNNGAVVSYDAWIPNLGNWDFLAEGQQNLTNPYVQAATIQGICPIIQDRCQGKDQQYAEYVPFSPRRKQTNCLVV